MNKEGFYCVIGWGLGMREEMKEVSASSWQEAGVVMSKERIKK